jgi:hypothetical protein
MMVAEVAALARQYIDEPDQTAVDDTVLATWLERAYDEFRAVVIDLDAYIYARSIVVALSSAKTLDLSTITAPIAGSAAAAGSRLYQLVDIYELNDATDQDSVIARLEPSLNLTSVYGFRKNYNLKGTTLFFPTEYTMPIRIDYIPEPNISWAAGVGGAAVYIDELGRFHDLIALMACSQYAVLDSANSEQIQQLLMTRKAQLMTYLEGRSGGMVEMVVDVGWM